MKGYVVEVKGPVVDVSFIGEELPKINDALKINIPAEKNNGFAINLTLEVALHIGNSKVRCIAMDSTDGLSRGMEVASTGTPISVPVGKGTLGRLFNVLGDPIVDLTEDMAAEEKARKVYENLIDITKDPEVISILLFLRQREVIHFNRFKELKEYYQSIGYWKKINNMLT